MKIQINKFITKLLASVLTVSALAVAAHAEDLAAKVKGKGMVTMVATADDEAFGVLAEGDAFAGNQFEVSGGVLTDGTACGFATFVFGEAFSAPWGADVITLQCVIDSGSVAEDGTVVLQGISFEEDFLDGAVIFEELSPFEIVADAAGQFSLRWCQLPALNLEVTQGHLKVK